MAAGSGLAEDDGGGGAALSRWAVLTGNVPHMDLAAHEALFTRRTVTRGSSVSSSLAGFARSSMSSMVESMGLSKRPSMTTMSRQSDL